MKNRKRRGWVSLCALAAFVLWTAAVCVVDVQPVGPEGSTVGFATLNTFVHRLTGVHMELYAITDWFGLIPLVVVVGFGVLGLVQWIGRKSLRKVDQSLFVLGGFYLVVLAAYAFFEVFAVNYRPVLLDGGLEASYPSSTTLLVMSVMPTAAIQVKSRMKYAAAGRWLIVAAAAFVVFMVVCRTISGVHWLTDIIGGVLLSTGLVAGYTALV